MYRVHRHSLSRWSQKAATLHLPWKLCMHMVEVAYPQNRSNSNLSRLFSGKKINKLRVPLCALSALCGSIFGNTLTLHMQMKWRPLLFLVYLIFISFLFCLPGTAFPTDDWMSRIWFDKWVHVGIFFCLALIYGWAFPPARRKWPIFLVTAIAYGLFVEFAQDSWIPNRGFDWGDWMADIVGVLAGLLFVRYYVKK